MEQSLQPSARDEDRAVPRPGEVEADSEPPVFMRWVPLAIPLAALTLLTCGAVILANAE